MKRLFWAGCLGGILSGCLGPLPPRGGPARTPPPAVPLPGPVETMPVPPGTEPLPPLVPPTETPVEAPSPTVEPTPRAAVLWVPVGKSNALQDARFLAARPHLRLTALLPDGYFTDDANGRAARALFQTLVSSGQVEMVMSLPGRPMMPLLMDTETAQQSATPLTLPTRFAWPEDVAEQVVLARSAYRRRWKTDPRGALLPWDTVAGSEMSEWARVKIQWGLLSSTSSAPTWEERSSLVLLRPVLPPATTVSARRAWFQRGPGEKSPTGSYWGPVQVGSLDELTVWATWAGGADRLVLGTVSDLVDGGLDRLGEPVPAAVPDFSPWIGDEEENRAWDLLGLTRRAVEEYKNSGQASVRGLDLVKRAVYAAESGVFFYGLGEDGDGSRVGDLKRDFLATLSQVFQLMGRPVPPEVRAGFGRGGGSTLPETESAFERTGTVLRWRDPASDDRGPGTYFYPTGHQYETGAWDLRLFEVTPEEETVQLRFMFTALPNPGKGPLGFSCPLVDVYIDINHSPGAGAQDLLPGRTGLVESVDGWEYVLTVDGWGARLQQFVPGGAPRTVASPLVEKTDSTGFTVHLPRRWVRGDPDSWGYSVLVMGRSSQGGPMPVGVDPSKEQFGGAVKAPRPAPPVIDVLTPLGVSQRRVLDVYRNDQDIVWPFVRAE